MIGSPVSRRGRSICIITAGTVQSSPRVVREALVLADAGFRVDVLCRSSSGEVRRLAAAQVFAELGQRASISDAGESATRRWWRRLQHGMSRQIYGTLATAIVPAASSVVQGGSALQRMCDSVEADLYIGHGIAGLAVAAKTGRARGKPWAFDAEDFHTAEMKESDWPAGRREIFRAVEARLIPRCAHITAASPGIADAYATAYGVKRPTVVLNLPLESWGSEAPADDRASGPSVFWISQTIGPNRGLECAVRAIGSARTRPHLYLQGSVSDGYRAELSRIAAIAGADQRVHLLDPCSPQDADRAPAGFDIGFAGEPGFCRNNEIALSNKLFAYMQSGLATVASDTSAHVDLARETGAFMSLFPRENPALLAAAVDALLENPARLANAQAVARSLASLRYNWEIERIALVETVDQSMGRLTLA
jgi:glycosyltransferase involved in cell wall biosynthesis